MPLPKFKILSTKVVADEGITLVEVDSSNAHNFKVLFALKEHLADIILKRFHYEGYGLYLTTIEINGVHHPVMSSNGMYLYVFIQTFG